MEIRFVNQLVSKGYVLLGDDKVLVPLGEYGTGGVAIINQDDFASAIANGVNHFWRGPEGTVVPNFSEMNKEYKRYEKKRG